MCGTGPWSNEIQVKQSVKIHLAIFVAYTLMVKFCKFGCVSTATALFKTDGSPKAHMVKAV